MARTRDALPYVINWYSRRRVPEFGKGRAAKPAPARESGLLQAAPKRLRVHRMQLRNGEYTVTLMSDTTFVHPLTKETLVSDDDGNLYAPGSKAPLRGNERGDSCDPDKPNEVLFENQDGSYDFVLHGDINGDRAHYDQSYERLSTSVSPIRCEDLEKEWREEVSFEALLESMGDLHGKRVLLLGNGMSTKEFYFASLGARVVFTDLSITGVRRMKEIFAHSELAEQYPSRLEFHAVDARQLPFASQSFDSIYGCAFVHHMQDLDPFFADVARCLKPGGQCVFFDDAYSGIWHAAKSTVLKPMQLYSHWRTGISPEDKFATKKGGFKRPELELLMRKHGFQQMTFERNSFFEYLVRRGAEKLGIRFVKVLLPAARTLDRCLKKRTHFISRQGIRLVWGFQK